VEDFEQLPLGLNPYDNDPGAWGPSLLTNAELVLAALEISQARSVAEIGAYAGDFTRLLLLWAEPRGAKVLAIDPSPQPELAQLAQERPELELIQDTSLAALERMPLSDVVILDGDHNYYTVSQELQRVSGRSAAEREHLPLVLLHDVCWPHGRRDDYYDPDLIPDEYLQPLLGGGGLYPGVDGLRDGGLPYRWPAAHEGGARNGVLTAAEDFVAGHDRSLRLAVIPTFYGLGVIWDQAAPYAQALGERLAFWDRNPLIARLERNRVLHLASSQVQQHRAMVAEDQLRQAKALLHRMVHSRAFAAAEWFLRLRHRQPAFSRAEARKLLDPE
jgi:hypothetical protein